MNADASPTSTAPVAPPAAGPAIDSELLAILACPLMRCPLELRGDELVATVPADAGLRYPVRGGIPVLLMDEAVLPDGVESLEAFKAQYAGQIPG